VVVVVAVASITKCAADPKSIGAGPAADVRGGATKGAAMAKAISSGFILLILRAGEFGIDEMMGCMPTG
jgi:hypothetical protein